MLDWRVYSSSVNVYSPDFNVTRHADKNGDGIVTEQEFISLPPGGDYDEEEETEVDRHWQKQRAKEFRNAIDLDHDGKVNKQELLVSTQLY